MHKRAELEELLQDLQRAQSHLGSAASNVGCAVRTAERGPLMSTFIEPVRQAEATLAAVWWQLEGHKAVVQVELAKLPPRTVEDAPRNARHA